MKTKPNIILIVMDTVRADHLSCYGYDRKTSPNIDKISKLGVLFEKCFTTASWSPPTHASIFTGKYPSSHRTLGIKVSLEPWNTTIAEVLKRHGYYTVGMTNCGFLSPELGFTKGFQKYYEMYGLHKFRNLFTLLRNYPNEIVRILVKGFDRQTHITNIEAKKVVSELKDRDKPFFLFINYFNCHASYDPPNPFKGKFCAGFSRTRLYLIEYVMRRFQKTAEKIHNGEFDIYKLRMISTKPEVRFSYMAGEFEISEEEWNLIKSWYDAEILYLDYHIGDLVNFLMHEGLFDDTLLIITADHGENLGEHGLADHHFSLYDNLLRVPLIMVYPNCIPSNTKVSSIVSSIDIFPTILDITRIKNSLRIQGVSLSSFEDRKIHDFICAERGSSLTSIDVSHLKKSFSPFRDKLRYIDKGAKCIRDENYKYILYEDGREELYNIYEDTNEQNNIIDEERKVADMMKEKLKRGLDLSYWGPRKNYWPKKSVIERLKSLGYI